MRPETRDPAAADACRSDAGVILIVEDNDTNALILRAMLRKNGYAAVVARDGAEGVEMAERLRPPLVLLDLHMPRLDGFAAAAEMQRRAEDEPPVIVAVTANVSPEVHAACLASGFVAVLPKPVVLAALISTVGRFIAPSRAPSAQDVIVSGQKSSSRNW
jgi:two-component system, sensor histidine kinase and response regulator